MDLLELMKSRHSVRKYKSEDIPDGEIRKLIEHCQNAPSGKNIQNWHFLVIKDAGFKEKLQDVIVTANEEISKKLDELDAERGMKFRKFCKNFTLFYMDAPVLIMVFTETYHPSGYYELRDTGASAEVLDRLVYKANPGMQSLGAAVEHFELAAVEAGYGSCWMTSANYASEEIEKLVREELGFDREGYFFGCMLTLGVPEGPAKSPGRKPIDDICTFYRAQT